MYTCSCAGPQMVQGNDVLFIKKISGFRRCLLIEISP